MSPERAVATPNAAYFHSGVVVGQIVLLPILVGQIVLLPILVGQIVLLPIFCLKKIKRCRHYTQQNLAAP